MHEGRDTARGAPARVSLDAVNCRLGNTQAVDDVTLHIAAGERIAITGPNGAGKSSLLRTIIGLLPASGSIAVDDVVAADRKAWKLRRQRVAWVPQRPAVGRFPLLVDELLASSGAPAAAREAAAQLGVEHLLGRPLNTLSGGQLQRTYLARGLGHVAAGASVLLADEPTSALDFDTRDAVAPVVVSQLFMSYWADWAGLTSAGTFGPQPMSAGELSELMGMSPTVVFDNYHVPGGQAFEAEGIARIELINYPGDDLDLLAVFQHNHDLIVKALDGEIEPNTDISVPDGGGHGEQSHGHGETETTTAHGEHSHGETETTVAAHGHGETATTGG